MEDLSYAKAGVDTAAGDLAVEMMKRQVRSTYTPAVVGDAGGFAGLVDATALTDMKRPLLATSTDGVGTKIELARQLDIHDTIGQDLVGMVVDDITVVGARPLFMTDYIACGRVVPERIAQIVTGIARACQEIDTALIGGETAEHPGVMEPDQYDIAGAVTGVVDADKLLGPDRVAEGDVLVALASSGLHSNGYSLVRAIVERAGWDLGANSTELGTTYGQALLEPTRLYSRLCLQIADRVGAGIHAFSHVTGGGLAANLARVLPKHLTALADQSSWQVPPLFTLLQQAGGVSDADASEAWNMGVGMVAVCDADSVEAVQSLAKSNDIDSWELGRVGNDSQFDASLQRVRGTKGADAGTVALTGQLRH